VRASDAKAPTSHEGDQDHQWIRAGKEAVKLTRLSCHRFRANEVRLWLSVIANNLGNLWRRLALPKRIDTWSLASPQQRLVKTGGRLVRHARYFWLLLPEGHLTRWLFGAVLRRLEVLPGARGVVARLLRLTRAGRRPRGTCLRKWLPARPCPEVGGHRNQDLGDDPKAIGETRRYFGRR